MAATGGVSVIVRARDVERNLGRCLELIGAQKRVGDVETILVDCGSRDRTLEVAAGHGATVVSAPAASSSGAALNLGVARAQGEVLVALSPHARTRDPGWLERLLEAFADPRVACACGDSYGPDGLRLDEPVTQDADLARRQPEWGYSDSAGAFRASLWRERAFREDLPACEDKEWALHWLEGGYVCHIDPALVVDRDLGHESLRSIYGRARREARGFAEFLGESPQSPAALTRDWWSDIRYYDTALRARLSPRRGARLLGLYAGRRSPGR